MESVPGLVLAALESAADRARAEGLPAALTDTLSQLAGQTRSDCVVAVVGQVKAGKSTFVNALLGEDLALVGELETTATINYFRYGRPPDPGRPIRCHWTNRSTTWEDAEFLRGLQGRDEVVLRRASGIHHLEYLLEHPLLRSVTLVDTPGTNAAVDEHQDRVAGFLDLPGQLRERHAAETEQLAREADAVLYVVGAVARVEDRSFLEEFGRTTRGRSSALNAVGLLTKIELGEEYVRRADELAGHLGVQLRGELNTVVPVGSGVHRALVELSRDDLAGLRRMRDVLTAVPSGRLDRMLAAEVRFLTREYPDCPVGPAARRELFDMLPADVRVWPVFATLARVLARSVDVGDACAELERIANFTALYDVLERHFLARGHLLRSYRVLVDAVRAVDDVRRRLEIDGIHGARERRRRAERMLAFVRDAQGPPDVARELGDLIRATVADPGTHDAAERACREIVATLEDLVGDLEQHNADFVALQLLDAHRDEFGPGERDELGPLLGTHGLDTRDRVGAAPTAEQVAAMQTRWQRRAMLVPSGSPCRQVYERAFVRAGYVLAELGTPADPTPRPEPARSVPTRPGPPGGDA